jgi:hypothetical protein
MVNKVATKLEQCLGEELIRALWASCHEWASFADSGSGPKDDALPGGRSARPPTGSASPAKGPRQGPDPISRWSIHDHMHQACHNRKSPRACAVLDFQPLLTECGKIAILGGGVARERPPSVAVSSRLHQALKFFESAISFHCARVRGDDVAGETGCTDSIRPVLGAWPGWQAGSHGRLRGSSRRFSVVSGYRAASPRPAPEDSGRDFGGDALGAGQLPVIG